MILFPPAKINLGLNVLGKRPDGYHEIETCMYPVQWFDLLELLQRDEFEFVQTGIVVDCPPDSNLCVRAFRMIQDRYSIPNVYMHLRKNIPMGAGLGGGSSDAAYVLIGLNELFSLDISKNDLRQMAGELGSDCPFFINSTPQIATGRGEFMENFELDLSDYFIKVVHPGIHIGTKEAYSGVRFIENRIALAGLLRQPIESWKHTLMNSFEYSIMTSNPKISDLKEQMYSEGAIYASMSGSGSSVYGIFKEEPTITITDTCWVAKL